MRTAENRLREGQRDGRFTNAPDPAPRGPEHSSVSEVSLTGLRHERLATTAGPAGLSPDLAKSAQVASVPPLAPGQARPGETSGVRNESSRFDRGTGTGKNTPER
jgi:hypothetical protein